MEKIRAVLPSAKDSLLVTRHGAVCFGPDLGAAFAAAQKLEESSQLLIIQQYMEKSGEKMPESLRRVFDYCAKAEAGESLPPLTAASRRESDSFLFLKDGTETRYARISEDMPEEARLHEEIYRLRPDANFIESTADDAVVSFSLKGDPLPSMLDDTAQMMGAAVNGAGDSPAGIAAAIRGGKRACLFAGRGGLSFAETQDEAYAGRLILEKNAAAFLCAELFGGAKPIPALECYLQHASYKNKYSKKK
jgi:L-fuculose-phosphate aldolase